MSFEWYNYLCTKQQSGGQKQGKAVPTPQKSIEGEGG